MKENLWDRYRDRQVKQKSPLRYPGGKSRAIEAILSLVPHDSDKLYSPFMGGGSVEIACAAVGLTVIASDIFHPLYIFWHQLKTNQSELVKFVYSNHPITKDAFYDLQQKIPKENNSLKEAGYFFVINRASFSGTTLSGGMSPKHPRFTTSSIERLANFNSDNITVLNQSFEEFLIRDTSDGVIYLDPPYLLEFSNLYGHKGNTHKEFNHELLRETLKSKKRWILSYNDCPAIRSLYDGFIFLTPHWKYGMSKNKASKEVIILSQDLADYWNFNGNP